MFSKISSGLLGWINRSETLSNHQPPPTSVKDQNNAKVEADTNGDYHGASLEDRVNRGIFPKERKEIKDCSSYLRTGFCYSGINCKFNHPPNWKLQVGKVKEREESVDSAYQEVKEKNDSKAEQVDSKYLDSPGVYKSPKASKVNHSTKPCRAEKLNFMGLPIRQGVRDCSFYMSNGSCKYGENCWFNHPNPISVEEYDNQSASSSERSILLPNASQSTPGLWSPALSENHLCVPSMFPSTQGVTSLPEWHDYQAPVYQPERNMQYSTSIQPPERNVAKFPERPAQPECNRFVETGYCNYMSACKFHHPKNDTAKPTSCTLGGSRLPLRPEAVVSPSYDATFTPKNYRKSKTKQPKPVPKEQNAMESVRCELCDIKCASIQLYKNHCYGKKHNLQKLEAQKQMSQAAQASQSTNAGKTRVVTDLERKEQKLLRRGTAVHSMTGQAHVAKANLGPTEKITANPTNGEDLVVHKEGKKHQTYVEKSQIPKVDPTCLASATTLPLMAPLKEPEDLETKIRKALECGAPEDSVKTCTLCSVVCNSQTVFNSHLAGQKHAAAVMEKQAEEETAITKNLPVDETSDKISSSGEMSTQSEKCMVDFKGKERNVLEGGTEVQSLSAFLCSDELLTGKKHPAQVEALTAKSEPNPNSATIPRPNSADKITTKSRKDESLWCQLCEIKCTRVEDLLIHEGGRKHKTKMEELQNPKTVETVDPTSPDDAEPKIEKVLNCGEAEAVKICTICYVTCKTETVFNSHMAGKKHASMVKKKQAHDANPTDSRGSITGLPVVEHPLA